MKYLYKCEKCGREFIITGSDDPDPEAYTESLIAWGKEIIDWWDTWNSRETPTEVGDPPIEELRKLIDTKPQVDIELVPKVYPPYCPYCGRKDDVKFVREN